MSSLTTVEAIFHAALERGNAAERAAFLDGACGGNAELRREVERLLTAQPALGSFLEQSPAPAAEPPPQTVDTPFVEGPGSWIGPYKLLQKLGEGGMGAVFLAEQSEPVRRRVAVKVIKPGLDSAQVLARFEAERQALALMDHPNIARVLDAGGTASGRPYFVMELVKGIPITRYCDQEHLTPRQRLELFVPVCQAVQHAHQKGIIHRDLKPSNVLIALYDGQPVPKVIDFGVAKATAQRLTERTMFTEVGQVVGTLEYMAPEQAELNNLDIDTRADIYSLGVLLYELLAGSPPFTAKQLRSAAFTEMLRIIREVEPPKPSTRLSSSEELPSIAANRKLEPARLTKQVQGDLDWIVMKCLEKERGRRYETANGLGLDLGRYLADEPVLASPPSKTYRLRKFLRKHRGPVLAAGLMALLLLAGALGTSLGYVQAERLRHQAETNEGKALEEKAHAESWQRQAMDALRAMTDDVVEQLLGARPALGPSDKAFLENTLKRWQAFASRQGEGEQARAIRAEGAFRVAFLKRALGQMAESLSGYREAIDEWQGLVTDFPGLPGYRQELARSLHSLAYVLDRQEKRAEAEAALRQALGLREKLAAEFPAVPAYRQEFASSLDNLAGLHQDMGKWTAAETNTREALAIREQLATDYPAMPPYRQELANSLDNLGVLLAALGKPVEAEAVYRQARAIREELIAKFPEVPAYRHECALGLNNLGTLLGERGKRAEAEAVQRQGLAVLRKLTTDFPAVSEYRAELASSLNNFGSLLGGDEKRAEAEATYREARVVAEKLVADFPAVPAYRRQLAQTLYNMGGFLEDDPEKRAEADALYGQALAVREKLAAEFPAVPEYRRGLALNLSDLGTRLWKSGRYAEAEAASRRALTLREKLAAEFFSVPQYRDDLAYSLGNKGGFLLEVLGKPAEAAVAFRQALAIREKLAGEFPDVPDYRIRLGGGQGDLGRVSREGKQFEQALEWYTKSIATLEDVQRQGKENLQAREFLSESYEARAQVFADLKQHIQAAADWDRAVELALEKERVRYRILRAAGRLRGGQVEAALKEVEEMAPQADADALYYAAGAYALASAGSDGKSLPSALKEQYARRSVELLRQAIANGYRDVKQLKKDDLIALRERDDFKQLLAELEAKVKAAGVAGRADSTGK